MAISARDELKHMVENLTESEAESALAAIAGDKADRLAVALHAGLQDLAAKIVTAYEDGQRSSSVDVHDIAETLLALADCIPAPE